MNRPDNYQILIIGARAWGSAIAKIVSEKTYQKILLDKENFIEIIKRSSSKITKRLEKRQDKKQKSIKDKYKLKKYIQLTKQIQIDTDNEIVKKLIKELCDLYANEIADDFSSKFYKIIKTFMLILLKLIQKIYNFQIYISGNLNNIYQISKHNTIIYTVMHKSHLDSLWIGLALALTNLPPVRYATGINLITNFLKKFFFKKIGAYTVDREETNNPLYISVLKQYSMFLIENGIDTLIFPEGLRSRTGEISPLKNGLLKAAIDAYSSKDKKYDIVVVPIAISYEEIPEDCLFCGEKKSLTLFDYIKNIKNVYIDFCNPIKISDLINNPNPVILLSNKILNEWGKNVKILAHQILCKALVDNNYEIQTDDLKNITKKILGSLNGNLYTLEVDNIINQGKSILEKKKLISENNGKIKAVNPKIINYYANMVPFNPSIHPFLKGGEGGLY